MARGTIGGASDLTDGQLNILHSEPFEAGPSQEHPSAFSTLYARGVWEGGAELTVQSSPDDVTWFDIDMPALTSNTDNPLNFAVKAVAFRIQLETTSDATEIDWWVR